MPLTWTHHKKSEHNPEFWAADKGEQIGICFAHQTCTGEWMIKNNSGEWGPFSNFEQAQDGAERLFGDAVEATEQGQCPLLEWKQVKDYWIGYRGNRLFFRIYKNTIFPDKPFHLVPNFGIDEEIDDDEYEACSQYLETLEIAKASAGKMLAKWLKDSKLRPEGQSVCL